MATLQPNAVDRAVAVMRAGIARGEAQAAILALADAQQMLRCEAAPSHDGQELPSADSLFLLASITKPFMGAAIMQLAEQGRLLLSDAVARYIPEFARYGKAEITIFHLLTHTSGLAEEMMSAVVEAKGSPQAHLEAACNAFTHFRSGSAYEYCNLSFWALGEIIQRVSGLSYPEYLRQHICEPLGLRDTTFLPEGEQCARALAVHAVREAQGGLAADWDYFATLALPAGGLWSTIDDLVRFGQALLDGVQGRRRTILSQASLAAMTRLQTAGLREFKTQQPAAYGLCFGKPSALMQTLGSPAAFGHGGATGTLLWIDPAYELVFVFLTNLWGSSNRVAYMTLNAVYGAMG
jgi:CubicO group peptidase (beta-lactamase class C family)